MDRNSPPPAPPRKRLKFSDYVVFSAVAALIIYAGYQVNDVLVYKWDWSRVLVFLVKWDPELKAYVGNLLLTGLYTTLRLAFWGTVLASIIGIIMGYWRTSKNLTLQIISRSYVELIRNIPPLVFIFIFYFFISSQIFPALGLEDIDPEGPIFNNAVFRFMFGQPGTFDKLPCWHALPGPVRSCVYH